MKRMKLLLTLALPVFLCQDIQAQTSSRMIAEAHWASNGAMFRPKDSTYYTFLSSARGGDLDHTMKFDNSTTWNYLGDTAYKNAWYTQQEFDADNNIVTSIVSMADTTSWVPSTKTLYTYTSGLMATKIMQVWTGTGWMTVSKNVYAYYPNNKLQSDQYLLWDTMTLHYNANMQKNYFYDLATNNLINETDVDLSSGAPVNTNQYAYIYVGTDLLTKTYTKWNGSIWVNNSLWTNTYDTTDNKISQQYQTWNDTSMAWVNVTLALYSNFTGKLPQTEVDKVWNPLSSGSWDYATQVTNTYNSYKQLTTSTSISYDISIPGWEYKLNDPMTRYYYGPYSNVSSVKNVVNNNGDANVYPVPAQGMLHVDIKWNEAQAATIAIYDMSGKVVRQWNAPYGTEYRSGVSVDGMAAGVYTIRISGTEGQIIKQMVVSH